MSRQTWDLIKNGKGFYIATYRKLASVLVWSMFFNIVLSLSVYYVYFQEPEPDYYSTNGITPPLELTPMSEPNETSRPLLATDVEANEGRKLIPN